MLPQSDSGCQRTSHGENVIANGDSSSPHRANPPASGFACRITSGDREQFVTSLQDFSPEIFTAASGPIYVQVGEFHTLPAEKCSQLLASLTDVPATVVWRGVDGVDTWAGDAIASAIRSGLTAFEAERIRQAALESYTHWDPPHLELACKHLASVLKTAGFQGYTARLNQSDFKKLLDSKLQLPNTPEGVAHSFLSSLAPESDCGERHMVLHRGSLMLYDAPTYKPCSDENLMVEITAYLQRTGLREFVTTGFVKDVLLNVRGMCRLGMDAAELPLTVDSWDPLVVRPAHLLNFENGLIDLDQLLNDPPSVDIIPHSPRHIYANHFPFGFDEQASCELWLQTLAQILAPPTNESDIHFYDFTADNRIRRIQELFGLSLLERRNILEMVLILFGNGANGKSVILNTWGNLLGPDSVSHLSLNALSSNFQVQTLRNRRLNVSNEIDHIDRLEEGIFKQLVSGDGINVDIKYKAPIDIRPNCLFAFATNVLPRFSDRSNGIWRRLCLIPLFTTFAENARDTGLATRLRPEYPGIFNWAVEGARRVRSTGRLTDCSVCESALRHHRAEADPVQMFVEEHVILVPGSQHLQVTTNEMHRRYQTWAEESGYRPISIALFGRQIRPLLEPRAVVSRQVLSGVRSTTYSGLQLVS